MHTKLCECRALRQTVLFASSVSCSSVAGYWYCSWLCHHPPHCNFRWANCTHYSGGKLDSMCVCAHCVWCFIKQAVHVATMLQKCALSHALCMLLSGAAPFYAYCDTPTQSPPPPPPPDIAAFPGYQPTPFKDEIW